MFDWLSEYNWRFLYLFLEFTLLSDVKVDNDDDYERIIFPEKISRDGMGKRKVCERVNEME